MRSQLDRPTVCAVASPSRSQFLDGTRQRHERLAQRFCRLGSLPFDPAKADAARQ